MLDSHSCTKSEEGGLVKLPGRLLLLIVSRRELPVQPYSEEQFSTVTAEGGAGVERSGTDTEFKSSNVYKWWVFDLGPGAFGQIGINSSAKTVSEAKDLRHPLKIVVQFGIDA